MKRISLSILLLIAAAVAASAFGAREHKAITIVAQSHLTPEAAAAVREITGGEKMAVFASHPDKFRKYYRINGKKIWHTYHVGPDFKPDQVAENSLFKAVETAVGALSGDGYKTLADRDSVQIYFSYIIHFIADLHCPGHVKYTDGDGCASPRKYSFGEKAIDFHKCWDTNFISEALGVSTMDMAYLTDIATEEEIAGFQKGDIYEWAVETATCCHGVTHDGEMNADGVVENNPYFTVSHALFNKRQAMKAAYRIAAVLNAMFK